VAFYFLAGINNLSRYERVLPLLRCCVGIYSDIEGVAVAMAVSLVEADLGERTVATGDMSRRGG
jgi:hypothetical protein